MLQLCFTDRLTDVVLELYFERGCDVRELLLCCAFAIGWLSCFVTMKLMGSARTANVRNGIKTIGVRTNRLSFTPSFLEKEEALKVFQTGN